MTEQVPPRIFRRVPFQTAVRLRFDDFAGFVTEYCGNISLGGMFIRSEHPPPVGTTLEVEFKLDDNFDLIRGRGKVIWSRAQAQGPELPAGMGLRFLELTPGSRELIFQVVDRYVRQGGMPFDLEEEAAAASARSAPPATPRISPPAPPPVSPPAAPPAAPIAVEKPQPVAPEPARVEPVVSPPPPPVPRRPPEPAEPIDSERRVPTSPRAPAAKSAFNFDPIPVSSPAPPVASAPPASPRGDRSTGLRGLDEILPSPEAIGAPVTGPRPPAGYGFGMNRSQVRKRRRWRPVALAAAVLVLVAGGALFAFRERVASWFTGTSAATAAVAASERGKAPPPAPSAGDPTAAPAPEAAAAAAVETVGGELAGDGPAAAEQAAPGEASSAMPAAAASSDPAGSAAASPPQPPIAAPGPTEPAADLPTRPAAATRIDSITWRQDGDATELVLWADGPIAPESVRHSRLEGAQPREVIRITGIAVPAEASELAVGSRQVRRVRTGLHLEVAPPELHVVVDLAGPGVEATAVEGEGDRLRVRLEGR